MHRVGRRLARVRLPRDVERQWTAGRNEAAAAEVGEPRLRCVEDRLPAHGIKPPIMTELFELEDERETIQKQLDSLKGREPDKEAT